MVKVKLLYEFDPTNFSQDTDKAFVSGIIAEMGTNEVVVANIQLPLVPTQNDGFCMKDFIDPSLPTSVLAFFADVFDGYWMWVQNTENLFRMDETGVYLEIYVDSLPI